MLDSHERAAVLALLIKTVRLMDARAADQKARTEINERLTELGQQLSRTREAFAVFGFDTGKDLWDKVREQLGPDYSQAFKIARGTVGVSTETPALKESAESQPEGSSEQTAEDGDVTTGSSAEGAASSTPNREPRVREIILEYLASMGEKGAQVRDIKAYMSLMYGLEPHEKTAGMTLYRLLKAGLVKRRGRTWVFASRAARDGSENPGAGAPGNNGDQKEGDQSHVDHGR